MMQFSIQQLGEQDVPFLWEMLYYAAHVDEDASQEVTEAIKQNRFLANYVEGWGRNGDTGVIAIDSTGQQKIGAAWLRLLLDDKTSASYYNDETPELAIAVHPQWIGNGVGSALLAHLIDQARSQYAAIVLTVRTDNPAQRLYERHGFVIIDEIENRVKTKSFKMLLTLK